MNRWEASMITITYVDLLLTVLTACAVASTVALVRGMSRAGTMAARVEQLLTRVEPMLPELDRLARETEETLRSVREVSSTAGDIARDVDRVTSEASKAALPLIRELADEARALRMALRHVSALAVGAKAGIAALARGRST
jgi:uncharacterized protein (DUF2252 family)